MGELKHKPVIILVRPQMGENIGAAARAMLNCGLTELRIVAPRDGWPNEKADANAAGADSVVKQAQLYDSVAEAVADLEFVYATSARQFTLNKPIDNLEEASVKLVATPKAGVLFGPERTGLTADDVVQAGRLLTIPLNPDFSSLNLAQAVLLVTYGWYRAAGVPPIDQSHRTDKTRPATGAEFDGLMQHLTEELDTSGFFTSPNKRPPMLRSLRALFARMEPSEQDVATLRGIIKALVIGRPKKK
jgi:tRNA/rRNA methyltransferase